MTVALVNLVFLDPASNGGLSRVAQEISQLLCEIADEHRHFHPVFAVNTQFVPHFSRWLGRSPSIIPFDLNYPARPALRGLNCDLIISPLFGVEPIHEISELRGRRHIAMMPDTLVLDMPQLFPRQVAAQRLASLQQLRNAYHIITISHYSNERLIHHLSLAEAQITPIPLGCDIALDTVRPSSQFDTYRPYLFYPANTWPHKRHALAFAAFALILRERPDMHLVLTGGRVKDFNVNIPALMAQHKLPEQSVIDLGFVDDSALASLYSHAEAMLFSSAYEGFGMPLLEAMRLGCPVICAPLSAIPEVAGDAALYVDSDDPAAWAQAVLSELPAQRAALLERGRLRAAGFTWAKTRAAYRDLLLKISPEIFNNTHKNVPMVTLEFALREAKESSAPSRTVLISPSASGGSAAPAILPPTDATASLSVLTDLLEQEKRSRWGKLPFVGAVFRTALRLRHLGRFWQASNDLAAGMVLRQTALAAAVEALRTDLSTDRTQE